jgi:hypothetical protein
MVFDPLALTKTMHNDEPIKSHIHEMSEISVCMRSSMS